MNTTPGGMTKVSDLSLPALVGPFDTAASLQSGDIFEGLLPKYSAWPASNPLRSNARATMQRAQRITLEPYAPQEPPTGSCRPSLVTQLQTKLTQRLIALEYASCHEDEMHLLKCEASRSILVSFSQHFKSYESILLACLAHYDALIERFSILRHSFGKLSDEAEEWRRKYSSLQEDHTKAIASQESVIAKFKKRMEDRRRENLVTQIDELKKDIADKEESIEEMTERNVRYIRNQVEQECRLLKLEKERDTATRELLDAKNGNHAELQRCLESLREHEKYRKKAEDTIKRLDLLVKEGNDKKFNLEGEVRHLQEEVKIMEHKTIRMQKEMKRIQKGSDGKSVNESGQFGNEESDWYILNQLEDHEAVYEDAVGNLLHVSQVSSKQKVSWLFQKWREAVAQVGRLQSSIGDRERLLRFMDEESKRSAPKKMDTEKSPKAFQGLGTDMTVPVHLRWAGTARNRLFPKTEIEMQIRDLRRYYEVWFVKNRNLSFSDCVLSWLRSKYGPTQLQQIMDHSYSFVDALKRFQDDTDCKLMSTILEGMVPHYCQKDEQNVVVRLQEWMVRLDQEQDSAGKITGKLSKNKLLAKLPQFFACYTEEQIDKLKTAIHTDENNPVIDYNKLFLNEDYFTESHFAESVRQIYLVHTLNLIEGMQKSVQACGGNDKNVSLATAVKALVDFDPKRPAEVYREFLIICYQPVHKSDQIKDDMVVEVEWLKKRFREVFLSPMPGSPRMTVADTMPPKPS